MTSPDTKTSILTAAVTLFSERGFSAVSMREIAKAVGISAAALYNHYASKEALYQAAVSAAFADKAGGLLATLNGSDPPLLRLERFVYQVARSVRQDPAFRALMQRELLDGDGTRLAFLGRMVFNQVEQPFVALLEELRPGCDAFLLTELIYGMLTKHDDMHLLRPFIAIPEAGERTPEQIAELVLQVLTPYFSGASQ